jgi:hypothetical protein
MAIRQLRGAISFGGSFIRFIKFGFLGAGKLSTAESGNGARPR